MAENLIAASVEVTLDGQVYTLRYRAFAFIAYAEQLGGDLIADLMAAGEELAKIGESLAKMGAAPGAAFAGGGKVFQKIRDVLWAGLLDRQPNITRDQVARMFGFDELASITERITAALNKSLPKPDAGAPARPTPAAANSHDLALIGGVPSGQHSETDAELTPPNLSS